MEPFKLIGGRAISAPSSGPDAQNVRMLSHYELETRRLRIQLQIDTAYLNQSRVLLCQVWTDSGWAEISSLLYTEIGKIQVMHRDGGLNEAGNQELLRLEALLLERALWVLEAE